MITRKSFLFSPSKESASPLHLIGIQEAARYTGVAVTTLYKWVGQRKIPHVKIGRLVSLTRPN